MAVLRSGLGAEREAGTSIRDVLIAPFAQRGTLQVPGDAVGLVMFAHGSGSSRFSPRNTMVAEALNRAGFATLLFDLLTEEEETDRRNVFDIALLADRLVHAIVWSNEDPILAKLPLGLFGASTGAAAALIAAARVGEKVAAIVSRGGRPDLAASAPGMVTAPTLFIVGGNDPSVLDLNEGALTLLKGPKALEIVPGASHLFPEPGAMEAVTGLATEWFRRFLRNDAVGETAPRKPAGRESDAISRSH